MHMNGCTMDFSMYAHGYTVQSHLHYCLKERTTSKQSLSGLIYATECSSVSLAQKQEIIISSVSQTGRAQRPLADEEHTIWYRPTRAAES